MGQFSLLEESEHDLVHKWPQLKLKIKLNVFYALILKILGISFKTHPMIVGQLIAEAWTTSTLLFDFWWLHDEIPFG